MAKLSGSYMGGFRGKLGTAVGYQWKGMWCVRSLPSQVSNPRTEAQQEHRMLFKQEVQLAGQMRRALNIGLGLESDKCHMTALNLFVRANQQAFSLMEGKLQVDWERLVISAGPVAPVAFGVPAVTGGTTLDIDFERNPLHQRAEKYDSVYLYVYCPEKEKGYLSAPVYREARHIGVVLPEMFAGCEVQLYGFVQDEEGRCSQTLYIGHGPLVEGSTTAEDEAFEEEDDTVITEPQTAVDTREEPTNIGAVSPGQPPS